MEMAISCILNSVRKLRSLTEWAKSPWAEMFKNTSLCPHVGLQEHQMANLCLLVIFPQEYGTHFHRSGTLSLLAMLLPGLTATLF